MAEPRYTEHHFAFACGTQVSLRLPPNITSVQVHIAPVGGTPAGNGAPSGR
jgi:hypothetical protein